MPLVHRRIAPGCCSRPGIVSDFIIRYESIVWSLCRKRATTMGLETRLTFQRARPAEISGKMEGYRRRTSQLFFCLITVSFTQCIYVYFFFIYWFIEFVSIDPFSHVPSEKVSSVSTLKISMLVTEEHSWTSQSRRNSKEHVPWASSGFRDIK